MPTDSNEPQRPQHPEFEDGDLFCVGNRTPEEIEQHYSDEKQYRIGTTPYGIDGNPLTDTDDLPVFKLVPARERGPVAVINPTREPVHYAGTT